jgi:hypothetical protein
MKWQSVNRIPENEKEVLVFCINDGLTFYDVDWWSKTRGCFVGSHSDGFEVLAWAKIEEPPQDIVEAKNTAANSAMDAITALLSETICLNEKATRANIYRALELLQQHQ